MPQKIYLQLAEYEKLFEVFLTIGTSLEVEGILQRIIEAALQLTHAQQGSIMLFDPVKQQEDRTLIRAGDIQGAQLDHFLNTLLAGWTRRYKKPLVSHNLRKTFGPKLIKEKYQDISSVLSVPLQLQKKIVGIINLISLRKEQKFDEGEVHLVNMLASFCAQFVHNARLHEKLFSETARLRKEVQEKYAFHGIIGKSPKMQQVFSLLERVIPTEGRVLLEGESGTGKELIARILHYCGPRKEGPFVAVDCGALPASLLESELFGYVKGAFTGAHHDKKGLLEEAHRGTLFLDEIVNMSNEVQSKFLRALEEGNFRPLGTTRLKKADVRIIAAASTNLREQIKAGNFRQDLFYRLNVVNILLPSLREREGDIVLLANHFLQKQREKYKKNLKGFKPETILYLEKYSWPGNVRELENIIERMVILAEDRVEYISPDLLPDEIKSLQFEFVRSTQLGNSSPNILSRRDAYEKEELMNTLSNQNWNQTASAKALGIAESTLRYKMQKYGLKKP
jgi:transcriptional regulator with GAF, ATPase, and Fis domain